MGIEARIQSKKDEATRIISSCVGKNGVWASSSRYKYQCWTRDFVIATEDVLLGWGQNEVVENHLTQLANRQEESGRIPIMYVDQPLPWLVSKIGNSIRNRRMSFLLKNYFSQDGIGQLSPWTKDSEILFVQGLIKYVDKTGDQEFLKAHQTNIEAALDYIETKIMREGLVFGGDWRDTRLDLDDKFLLTNNCLLSHTYEALGDEQKSKSVSDEINRQFWNGQYYRDYLGVDNFDTLGNAMAVLYDIAPAQYHDSIFKSAESLDTPFGYKLNDVTLPPKSKEETAIMLRTNQFGVIWPFIHGFMILAALKAGRSDLAQRQFQKWNQLDGFYEFYDPLTGKGHGSNEQVWSAALYLRVADALSRQSKVFG